MLAAEFLATAELLPEPMLLVNREGRLLAANAPFLAAAGLSRAEVTERNLADLVWEPPEQLEEYLRLCSRSGQAVLGALTLKQSGARVAYRSDGVACRGSGELKCILLRLRPKAESLAAFATLTDKVSQLNAQMARREEVEDSLRRQSETLEVTLASIGDAVIVANASGAITFMNAVAEELTGWSTPEATGRALAEVFRIINEHTRRPVENPVDKVLQTGGIIGLANHTLLLDKNGREVPIDDSAAPIRLPNGDLFGVVLIFRDITEQKKAEHLRSWLAAIIESSDDAIIGKTLDGVISSWNRGATRIFGYSAEEIIGKPITTIIPPDLHEEERAILAKLRAGERVEHFDTVRVAKGGRRVDISLTVSPVRDAHGAIVGASKVARDVTDRKRTERELRDANRRKDEFLATLAHELRNPLAPIRNAADMLSRVSLDPTAASARDIIERQVTQMTHLINDLLDVSRISSGRVRLNVESLDLGAALSLAIETCRPALDAAKQVLHLDSPPEPLFVEGDRVRLPQVFANILNNAVKFTPAGGRIDVQLARERSEAVVRIRDNGIGIPPSMLKYVFELFAQLDRSYDRTGGGLGLGLTLAKRLTELQGGTIEAHSEGANQGSEFIVRLKAVDVAPEPRHPPARSPTAPRRRVLIADDNADAATSLSLLLQMMGHETRVVHDGLAAVNAADEMRPDVVILDIGMPHLDGYAAAERMRARPWSVHTMFVALTGWGQDNDRRRALEAGFDHHLLKPADPESLELLLGNPLPRQ
jgi:PAS domain S-box-containing protein